MSIYRNALPQLDGGVMLTDGGLETTLVFDEGIDLPCFAAFGLLADRAGRSVLRRYYRKYADIAVEAGFGFVLESPTWRANSDWATELGYSASQLANINRDSIRLMEELRNEYQERIEPIVISGNIGPRGDGYVASELMSPEEAAEYHRAQIGVFAETGADMVSAVTMTHAEEAIGIVKSARQHQMPVAISFTTETDGKLPSGQPLGDAIEQVDAATDSAAAYFMVNCAHPDHFSDSLDRKAAWTRRIRGIRANASRCSHEELDEATELDSGDPKEFGFLNGRLRKLFPNIAVLGGCCGTDHRHVAAIGAAVAS
ncbi:MAG TPA: homocysteine S-methyltransferase family protein [Xanthomonadales bacterium]|nr:homocysteine S-methyltransferase family protein [Xanthomonadales bacterium]